MNLRLIRIKGGISFSCSYNTLEKLTAARTAALQASGPAETAKAENLFRKSLQRLFAVPGAYRDLKANQNFLQLQTKLKDLEDGIESARRYYNAASSATFPRPTQTVLAIVTPRARRTVHRRPPRGRLFSKPPGRLRPTWRRPCDYAFYFLDWDWA
jgi:hypothetical protein